MYRHLQQYCSHNVAQNDGKIVLERTEMLWEKGGKCWLEECFRNPFYLGLLEVQGPNTPTILENIHCLFLQNFVNLNVI